MIPLPLILKAIKKYNSKIKDAKGAAEGQGSTNIEKAGDGSADVVSNSEKTTSISIPSEAPNLDVSNISGAGYRSFLELADESLKLWLGAVRLITYAPPVSETLQLDGMPWVESISVVAPNAPISVVSDANYNLETAVEQETEERDQGSQILLVFLLGLVAYLGVRLVMKNGKPKLTIEKDRARQAINSFTGTEKDYYMPTFTYGETGSIQDRMGLKGYRISTPYTDYSSFHGRAHHAIDIAAPIGTPIFAPTSGTVTFIRANSKDAGNYIEFRGDDGVGYRLLHLDGIDVKAGQRFEAGQQIARVGNTGHSSGAHLHLEAYNGAEAVKVGETMYKNQKLEQINPLSVGSTGVIREYQSAEGRLESGEVPLNVSFPKETKIGTQGYNYLSVQGNFAWEGRNGQIITDDGRYFATFESADKGIRAGAMNLKLYQTKHDVSGNKGQWTTIAEIARNSKGHNYVTTKNGDRIEEWVSAVSRKSGYTPNQRVDLRDPEQLARVVAGIAFAEHSVQLQPDQVEQVIRHYNITNGIPSNKQ